MSNPLAIRMTITSSGFLGEKVDKNGVLNFIKNNSKDIDIYKIEYNNKYEADGGFAPSGFVAAYDIVFLLGITADLATIGTLVWLGYKKFVEKHKTKSMRFCIGEGKDMVEFELNKNFRDKDIFVKIFTEKALKVKESDGAKEYYESVTREIRIQDKWKKF